MKVILNRDLSPLGEEGDVKDVAKGYARNYLFPKGIALPYNEKTVKLFESRREEIESRKAQKRNDAAGLKEKLESQNIEISMPAGANGRLYGAVTSQTISEELTKQGFQIERKRIEIQGMSIKSVGKYKVIIKLYEGAAAEITVNILGQEIKTETRSAPAARPGKRRRDTAETAASNEAGASSEAASSNEDGAVQDGGESVAEQSDAGTSTDVNTEENAVE